MNLPIARGKSGRPQRTPSAACRRVGLRQGGVLTSIERRAWLTRRTIGWGRSVARTALPCGTTALAAGADEPLFGATFGLVVVALNHAEPTLLRSLSMVTGGGAGWATFGILVAAWWRRRLVHSIAAATITLTVAVAAYYFADAVAAGSPVAHDLGEMRFWIIGALVVGPPLGLIGWRARGDDTRVGVATMLIPSLGFVVESALYLDGSEWLSPLERVTRLTIIGVALTVAVVIVVRKRPQVVKAAGR